MEQGKPGRVLFWVSLASWAAGWWIAASNYAGQRDRDTAVLAFALWCLGAFTGVLWLIVKMWAILCRVKRNSTTTDCAPRNRPASIPSGFLEPAPRQPGDVDYLLHEVRRPRGVLSSRQVLQAVAVGIAAAFVVVCSIEAWALLHAMPAAASSPARIAAPAAPAHTQKPASAAQKPARQAFHGVIQAPNPTPSR